MNFKDMTGQKVPNMTFHTRENGDWKAVSTAELFDNRTVVVFSLPGAFTPTCSLAHLPRYNELASEFKALGVDEIVCISVNDAFVMNAWKAEQKAENITLMPDGNGEFTQGMGLLVSKESAGLGKRSWRYSMLVKNGVVEKMFIEAPDAFEVSDAETMIKYLKPDWQPKPFVSIITKPGCPYCIKAKALLEAKGFAYEEVVLERDLTAVSLRAISGRKTVPQVFIGGQHIGGSDDLETYFAQK